MYVCACVRACARARVFIFMNVSMTVCVHVRACVRVLVLIIPLRWDLLLRTPRSVSGQMHD